MGIFHRRCRRFQGTAFDKVAPQRLTAGDQAVMAVGKRKHGQEGNRLPARSADTATNRNPVMLFVMSLLLAAAMTNDRILRANWAPANDYFCASLPQSASRLLCAAENAIKTIVQWGSALGTVTSRDLPRAEPSPPFKISTGKEYRISAMPILPPA